MEKGATFHFYPFDFQTRVSYLLETEPHVLAVDVECTMPICAGYYLEARATAVSLKGHSAALFGCRGGGGGSGGEGQLACVGWGQTELRLVGSNGG